MRYPVSIVWLRRKKFRNPDPYLTENQRFILRCTLIYPYKTLVLAPKHFSQRDTSTIRSATVQRTGYQRLAFADRLRNAQKSLCEWRHTGRLWLIENRPYQIPGSSRLPKLFVFRQRHIDRTNLRILFPLVHILSSPRENNITNTLGIVKQEVFLLRKNPGRPLASLFLH